VTAGRADVIAYLRWLADQPDGIKHRAMLYRAAYALTHDPRPDRPHPEQERHGDQTT
jgi:hypothetical protein